MEQRPGAWGLLCAVLVVIGAAVAAPATADPETTVVIQIKRDGGDREIEVKNRGVGLCKKGGKCTSDITWEWKRKDEVPGEKIVIEFAGGTPDAEKCFDKTRYEIGQPGTAVTVSVSDSCPSGKTAWFYDIKCEKDGNACAGIDAVDPGVIIDG